MQTFEVRGENIFKITEQAMNCADNLQHFNVWGEKFYVHWESYNENYIRP